MSVEEKLLKQLKMVVKAAGLKKMGLKTRHESCRNDGAYPWASIHLESKHHVEFNIYSFRIKGFRREYHMYLKIGIPKYNLAAMAFSAEEALEIFPVLVKQYKKSMRECKGRDERWYEHLSSKYTKGKATHEKGASKSEGPRREKRPAKRVQLF